MEKIRILYMITNLNIGGAEMMLYRMLGKLNRDLFDATVVSLIEKSELGERIESDYGIPVHSLNISHSLNSIKSVFLLGTIIKAWSPHIVHSHMFHANMLIRITRIFYRFPVLICTIHNINERGRRKSALLREALYRITDFLCDLTTQVSRAGLDRYIKIRAVPINKIIYIPNGIDTSLFSADNIEAGLYRNDFDLIDKYIFLAVGYLTVQKDYPNMIAAFSKVIDKMPDAVLLIAGDGPLEGELQTLVKQNNLINQIIFLGMCKNLPLLMSLADTFVMSSAWEGLPTVVLEAAASKLPIIVTDVGGSGEVVINGKSGFVVPAKDPDALGRAMIKIMQMSEDERAQMGLNGYNYVKENYDIKVVTQQWEAIYHDMLEL
jgi:glycosyltransferase involved in cell wall biosynthesis